MSHHLLKFSGRDCNLDAHDAAIQQLVLCSRFSRKLLEKASSSSSSVIVNLKRMLMNLKDYSSKSEQTLRDSQYDEVRHVMIEFFEVEDPNNNIYQQQCVIKFISSILHKLDQLPSSSCPVFPHRTLLQTSRIGESSNEIMMTNCLELSQYSVHPFTLTLQQIFSTFCNFITLPSSLIISMELRRDRRINISPTLKIVEKSTTDGNVRRCHYRLVGVVWHSCGEYCGALVTPFDIGNGICSGCWLVVSQEMMRRDDDFDFSKHNEQWKTVRYQLVKEESIDDWNDENNYAIDYGVVIVGRSTVRRQRGDE